MTIESFTILELNYKYNEMYKSVVVYENKKRAEYSPFYFYDFTSIL